LNAAPMIFRLTELVTPSSLFLPFCIILSWQGKNLRNPNQSQSQFSCNASFILLTTKMICGFMMSVKNLWLGQVQKRTLLRGIMCPNITVSGMAHWQYAFFGCCAGWASYGGSYHIIETTMADCWRHFHFSFQHDVFLYEPRTVNVL
jgi:hypothetical protein